MLETSQRTQTGDIGGGYRLNVCAGVMSKCTKKTRSLRGSEPEQMYVSTIISSQRQLKDHLKLINLWKTSRWDSDITLGTLQGNIILFYIHVYLGLEPLIVKI